MFNYNLLFFSIFFFCTWGNIVNYNSDPIIYKLELKSHGSVNVEKFQGSLLFINCSSFEKSS